MAATFLENDRQRAERLDQENRELRARNTTLRNELNVMDARRQRAEDEHAQELANLRSMFAESDLQ